MISKPTLFILGAGAHCPYQLPDGASLYRQIIEKLPAKATPMRQGAIGNSLHDLFWVLYGERYSSPESLLVDFRTAMQGAGFPSIDGFMYEHRNVAAFPEIGRLVVPYVLRPREFKVQFNRNSVIGLDGQDQDWMSNLFKLMLDGIDGLEDFFEKNKVAFITFNYDRTLEHFLYIRLLHSFHLKPADALAAVKRIEIQHVYGSFGDYDPAKIEDEPFIAQDLQAAGKNIHLMYEQRGQNPGVERAKQLLHTHYQHWVFLGFAFDSANIKILELDRASPSIHISATRYGVPDGEWARCARAMKGARFLIVGGPTHDSLAFLRETNWYG